MPEYIETADDLNKKFHQTYVKYNGQLCVVTHFDYNRDANKLYVTLLTPVAKGGTTSTVVEADVSAIDPIYFDATFLNFFSEDVIAATLFFRRPRRQWKRGLCSENTLLRCPLTSIYKLLGKKANYMSQLSFKLVEALLNNQFPTIRDAFDLVGQYQAVAISPLFAITLSHISADRCLLASHHGFVGEITRDKVWIHHPPALQEVRDFLRRTNQEMEIVHAS